MHAILGTDQNFDLLKVNQHRSTAELLSHTFSSGPLPTITKPTRITHSSAALIDNLYITSKNIDKFFSGIIQTDISDHLPLFLLVNSGHCSTKTASLSFNARKLDENSLRNLKHNLSNVHWNDILTMDVESAFQSFQQKILDNLDVCAPLRTVTIPSNRVIRDPWFTPGLLKSSLKLDRLFRKKLRNPPDHQSHITYKNYRNIYNRTKRASKEIYFGTLLNQYHNDIRMTWKIIRPTLGKCRDKIEVSTTFRVRTSNISDPNITAEEFCKYFTNVGKATAATIPNVNVDPYSFLHNSRHNSRLL